ncbi:unnamed protein product [Leuciscus chuanchicus]
MGGEKLRNRLVITSEHLEKRRWFQFTWPHFLSPPWLPFGHSNTPFASRLSSLLLSRHLYEECGDATLCASSGRPMKRRYRRKRSGLVENSAHIYRLIRERERPLNAGR